MIMPKVLIVAGIMPQKQARLRSIIAAFQTLSCETQTFNYRTWYFNHTKLTNRIINYLLVLACKRYKPDILYVIKGESLLPGIIKRVKKLGITTINRTVEEPFGVHSPKMLIKNIMEYDYLFSYDRWVVRKLSKERKHVYYLPCETATDFIQPLQEKKKYPVTFIGSYYPDREELLSHLLDFDLHIWGPGWDTVAKTSPLAKHIHYGESSYESAYVRLLNESIITVNLHHKQSVESANYRVFEAPATKTFLVTDYNKELPRLFVPGKELVTYRNITELRKLLTYYLKHEKERQQIAENAYKRVLKEHTTLHRIRQVLETAKKK